MRWFLLSSGAVPVINRSTFLVTVTPAHENAGEYQVSSEVSGLPDDVDFLTMYECSDADEALGYFDGVVHKLGLCLWDDLGWLDSFNQCLTIGDLAQVTLYQVIVKSKELSKMANTVITVGSKVRE